MLPQEYADIPTISAEQINFIYSQICSRPKFAYRGFEAQYDWILAESYGEFAAEASNLLKGDLFYDTQTKS